MPAPGVPPMTRARSNNAIAADAVLGYRARLF